MILVALGSCRKGAKVILPTGRTGEVIGSRGRAVEVVADQTSFTLPAGLLVRQVPRGLKR